MVHYDEWFIRRGRWNGGRYMYVRHGKRVGKSSTLVSFRGNASWWCAWNEVTARSWTRCRFGIVWHASNNARNYDAFQPPIRSRSSPDASRQYSANVPSHLPILSHFCVPIVRPIQPTRMHELASATDRWWLLYRDRRGITIVPVGASQVENEYRFR